MPSRSVIRAPVRGVIVSALRLPSPLAFMPLRINTALLIGSGSETYARVNPISTYLDNDTGLITSATANVARFEVTGLLMEGASTNLFTRSEEFDHADWTKDGVGLTADTSTDPKGTTTADTQKEDTTLGEHFTEQQLAVVAGNAYSFSSFGKNSVGVRRVEIRTAATSTSSTTFDFITDAITAAGGAEHDSSTLLSLANGWRRITDTFTAAASASPVFRVQMLDVTTRVYTGDNVSAMLPWGGVLEQLAFPSSYIPTISTTVTRSADSLDIPAANMPAPTADYTVSFECDHVGLDAALSQVLFNVEGETTRSIEWDTTTGAIKATHGAVTSTSTSTFTAGQAVKVAFVVDGTNQTLYINGVQEDQDAKGTVTGTATLVNIGHAANADEAYSHITNLKTFDVALSANQVKGL